MSFKEIKDAVDSIGQGFEVFKTANDGRLVEIMKTIKGNDARLVERIEAIEAGGKMPTKGAGSGHPANGGILFKMASDPALQEGLKRQQNTVIEVKATLRDILREVKTPLTSDLGTGSPSASYPVFQQRLDEIYNDPRRAIRLLDVLPHQPVANTNKIEFLRLDPSYSPTAAVQASEGADKSEATIHATAQTANIFTVANFIPCSTQVLSDVPSLQTYISGLLKQAILLQLEDQLINGASAQVTGLLEGVTTFAATSTASADKIGECKTALETIGWNPDVVLMNPTDWFQIRSERASGGGDGQYVSQGGWRGTAGKMWDTLTPVASPLIAENTSLVFDSSQMKLFDREVITLKLGFVNQQFTQNMVTLLVEGRFGFAIFSPNAVRKVAI